MKVIFETRQDWTLAIKFVNVRDQGVYVCQVKSSEQCQSRDLKFQYRWFRMPAAEIFVDHTPLCTVLGGIEWGHPLLTEGEGNSTLSGFQICWSSPPALSTPIQPSSSQPHTVQARWENSLCGEQPQQFPMKGEFI